MKITNLFKRKQEDNEYKDMQDGIMINGKYYGKYCNKFDEFFIETLYELEEGTHTIGMKCFNKVLIRQAIIEKLMDRNMYKISFIHVPYLLSCRDKDVVIRKRIHTRYEIVILEKDDVVPVDYIIERRSLCGETQGI